MPANNIHINLLVGLKRGDHTAFKNIFDTYVQKVFHYIYGYVKNRQIAEDCTQDVFKKLWEKREKLNESGNLEGLLFKLCYHQVIDHYRSEKRSVIKVADGNIIECADKQNTDNKIEADQLQALYHEAINQLPQKRKEVFLMSKEEGMSNKEIASKLSISVKTVENQMTSSLHFIKGFLRKAGQFVFCVL